MSSNPRGKFQPRTVAQLLALTKQRAIDRPAERRTWDQGSTYFVIQDPFDYHIVRHADLSLSLSPAGALICGLRQNHTWSLNDDFMRWFNKTLRLFSESLGGKQSLEESLKCIQHPEKVLPSLWPPAFKQGGKSSVRRPTPLDLEGDLWQNIKNDLEHIKPS